MLYLTELLTDVVQCGVVIQDCSGKVPQTDGSMPPLLQHDHALVQRFHHHEQHVPVDGLVANPFRLVRYVP